jgi:hypothetical protein
MGSAPGSPTANASSAVGTREDVDGDAGRGRRRASWLRRRLGGTDPKARWWLGVAADVGSEAGGARSPEGPLSRPRSPVA